jgi:hypothetical protein
MARRTKHTTERAETIVKALRDGNTRQTACRLAGVDLHTLARWMARFASFASAIEKAEAEAEGANVANIRREADGGTWQASAWWLERRRRDDWGKIDRVEVEVRRAAERIAAQTGADPDWLVNRAREIAAGAEVAP